MSDRTGAEATTKTLALSAAGVIGSCIFMVLPVLVSGLVQQGRFSAAQAGLFGAAPLLGMFAGSVALAAVLTRITPRQVVTIASLSLSGAYFLSANFLSNLPIMFIAQLLGGMAGVSMMSLALSTLARTGIPERNFGAFITAQMIVGAVGILALEYLISAHGVTAAFLGLGAFSAAPLLVLPLLPAGLSLRSPSHIVTNSVAGVRVVLGRAGAMALLAQLSFGVGIMLLWSFAGQLGAAHGFTASAVAQVLSASLFASIAGSLVAALIGTRRWSNWVMILGTVLIVASTALAAISSDFAVFAITLMAFGFCWNLLPSFQLGIASRLDFTGRLVVLSIAAVKLGYAVGTAAGGFVSTRISFQGVAAVAGVCFIFSLTLFRSASRGVHV